MPPTDLDARTLMVEFSLTAEDADLVAKCLRHHTWRKYAELDTDRLNRIAAGVERSTEHAIKGHRAYLASEALRFAVEAYDEASDSVVGFDDLTAVLKAWGYTLTNEGKTDDENSHKTDPQADPQVAESSRPQVEILDPEEKGY